METAALARAGHYLVSHWPIVAADPPTSLRALSHFWWLDFYFMHEIQLGCSYLNKWAVSVLLTGFPVWDWNAMGVCPLTTCFYGINSRLPDMPLRSGQHAGWWFMLPGWVGIMEKPWIWNWPEPIRGFLVLETGHDCGFYSFAHPWRMLPRFILRGRRSTWSTSWFFRVAGATFSAAKGHFAWQAQRLKHVMIKKWRAAVAKPAIVTCFARLKKLEI